MRGGTTARAFSLSKKLQEPRTRGNIMKHALLSSSKHQSALLSLGRTDRQKERFGFLKKK